MRSIAGVSVEDQDRRSRLLHRSIPPRQEPGPQAQSIGGPKLDRLGIVGQQPRIRGGGIREIDHAALGEVEECEQRQGDHNHDQERAQDHVHGRRASGWTGDP
jgi:hypothetical protein